MSFKISCWTFRNVYSMHLHTLWLSSVYRVYVFEIDFADLATLPVDGRFCLAFFAFAFWNVNRFVLARPSFLGAVLCVWRGGGGKGAGGGALGWNKLALEVSLNATHKSMQQKICIHDE